MYRSPIRPCSTIGWPASSRISTRYPAPACRKCRSARRRAVGDEDVQHLGRADAVDDLHAVVGGEALADLSRQRLAGGRTQPQRHRFLRRQGGRGQHAGVAGRCAEEHARPALGPAPEDRLRRRPLGHQQHGRADRQREAQRVAQPVGEEELRRREAEVVLAQAELRLAVQLRGPVGVGVRVRRALGRRGADDTARKRSRRHGCGGGSIGAARPARPRSRRSRPAGSRRARR